MIRLQQVKLPPGHTEEALIKKISRLLKLDPKDILGYKIVKQSLDARKKSDIQYSYTIDITAAQEEKIIKKLRDKNVTLAADQPYVFPERGTQMLKHRPVIVGSGPAGLVCALLLSRQGYCPVLLERGECVEDRIKSVRTFWERGKLNPVSNVQFGEGGAGTFSDGKLNTLVKDPSGRNREVLRLFVEAGAPEEILYKNKPHIGTDILADVVKHMRQEIESNGGEVRFLSQMTGFSVKDKRLCEIQVNGRETIETEVLVLAVGHSARDTFSMLFENKVEMSAKSFAVGIRIQHPQKLINKAQYGTKSHPHLPNAEYKLAKTLENGRGVYSFCMCPGGYVVDASSEEGLLAVNGMSYSKRDGENANSAIIVTVGPKDFKDASPLAGIEFQRRLEEKAYAAGEGCIPVQRYEDFVKGVKSTSFGHVLPQLKGQYRLSDIRCIFPEEIGDTIAEGIAAFDRQIEGFADPDALLAAVESRTSSPVRITRNEDFESNIKGIYPCGEGAGYAGGITSAAMDGIKVAEAIAKQYRFR